MSRYVVTRAAEQDLEAIWAHIAIASHQPVAADRLLERFFEKFRLLGTHRSSASAGPT